MRAYAGIGLLAVACAAGAQNYPERQITMVVPFTAGGSTDIVARTVAQRMAELLGQSVVVLNRVGADGTIGAESVVRAPADGYTVLAGTTALAIGPAVSQKMNYDVLKDLAPVTQLVVTPNVLAVHPSMPVKSVKELIALAKSRPGQLNSGSGGSGTSNHLALMLFNSMAGVNIAHIPYKGAGPALIDIVGGHIDLTFAPIVAAVQLILGGKLRALAVTTLVRATALPAVPTIDQAGLPGYEASSWVGLFVPAATPAAVISRLSSTAVESLRATSVKDAMSRNSAEPVGNSPEQFAGAFRQEIEKWTRVAKASGARLP